MAVIGRWAIKAAHPDIVMKSFSDVRLLLKRSVFFEGPNFHKVNSFRFNSLNRSQFSVDMRFGAPTA